LQNFFFVHYFLTEAKLVSLAGFIFINIFPIRKLYTIPMDKQTVYTKKAPEPIGPYSQAIRVGDLLFLSGQIAIEPESGQVVMDNIDAETHQVMKNILAILEQAELTFRQVVKSSIFLKSMGDFGAVNEVYGSYFAGVDPPARETVEVSELPKGVNVEISIIAHF